MVRKNIKRFSIMLVTLFFIGLAGLFYGLIEINDIYVKDKSELLTLREDLEKSRTSNNIKDLKLTNYDFMEYKINAFSTRYPMYSNIVDSVYSKSIEYDFKPELVLSIIQVESNFNPKAISYRGAYGLMQINLAVWDDELNIDKNRIFELEYNIDLGLQVLKRYYDESNGNLKRAIHLYNNGYKYNNLKYVKKIDSTMISFTPFRADRKTIASPN
ncbi:MAG: lytic transglycosylase domain-containing protein [Acidobacteriota bacterium]